VVLPTYNQSGYLPMALDGVLHQTWRDWELIVVNDGSTDDTRRVLDLYQQRHHFTVIHQENQKLPSALNTGFRQARGQYLTWTSSDNVMLPRMLETLVDALDRHPEVGLVYADWEVIDECGAVIGDVRTLDYDRYLLMRTNYINACFLYRRECQDLLGLYDPEYLYEEDWEYWWRIAQSFKMMRVPQMLYQYRVHGGSLSTMEVLGTARAQSVRRSKLASLFRSRPWTWYYSKLKWEWLRLRLGQDPRLRLEPYAKGKRPK
jgi:glycosyltransferase involved in cell wall biosynthesis